MHGALAQAQARPIMDDDGAVAAPSSSPRVVCCRVTGLSKAFPGGVEVLNAISFDILEGQSVALIGSNGAGKSTLLRCCVRLIEPSAGSVMVLGETITSLSSRQLRKIRSRIGFVFQKHNLVPRLSVLTNVLHGAQAREGGLRCWYQGLAPQHLRNEAMACLDRVGLADLAGRRADRLSGGQSQRVAIARALMQRPDLVMADEPVASLDPAAGEEVMHLFVNLLKEDGITLAFTSHNLSHALGYAERVIALKEGQIAIDAPSASLDTEKLGYIYE